MSNKMQKNPTPMNVKTGAKGNGNAVVTGYSFKSGHIEPIFSTSSRTDMLVSKATVIADSEESRISLRPIVRILRPEMGGAVRI